MRRVVIIALALCLAVLLLGLAFSPVVMPGVQVLAGPSPQQVVQRAWELSRQAGAYRFTAQVDQFTVPLPIPSNVGKQSKQQSIRLEGSTDLVGRKMEMSLETAGGGPLDRQSGTQIRIDGEQAYSRQAGQGWQAIDDFSSAIAPQSDFMAFLAGAQNVALVEAGGAGQPAHYRFEVNGPGFAAYLKESMARQLAAQGKLPPGVELDLAQQFALMTGAGEIWIGADGLPVRQELHVQFPPGSAEQVQADIVVTFADFGPLPAAAAAALSPLDRLLQALQTQAARDGLLTAGFLALFAAALLLGLRRKPVYAAIVVTIILAMVAGPLLQSVQAAGFNRWQAAQARAQDQRQALSEAAQALRAPQAPAVNPNASPLEKALAAQAAASADPAAPLALLPGQRGASTSAALAATLDSDGDGLTDDKEALLGTDPTMPDTDGDTLSDYAEVTGFTTPDARRWYGDPLNIDTNGDGVGDQREWALDSDGDQNPDLWSRDNDSDGVPDQADLSPFEALSNTFNGDQPYAFTIEDLNPGVMTYAEFQLLPLDRSHLRYTFNVLDWPRGDVQGQMMDEDGKTFKDVNPDSTDPQDAYGDVKLVPMLEIQINGEPTNLPDEQTLTSYGISVRDVNEEGSQKVVYVPLQIVKDGGDNWVAFYAKMAYLPAATWGNPQQVRLVWAVEALVDLCAEEGLEDGICSEFETYNELQVIQTYYDSFTLTGLNIAEQHGSRWAVTYKDPAVNTGGSGTTAARINGFDPLSDLVFGLDHSFLAGRLGANGERDFPVSEIRRRFDHTVNASVPISPTRFGISDNNLLVNQYKYAHTDLAYTQISVTETKKILNIYTPYWNPSQPITPTILFAHEEAYRPLNLDSLGAYSNISSRDGYTYTLAMPGSVASGSSLAPIEVITATALNWAPYIYQDGEWRGAPLDDYLEDIRYIYPPSTIDPNPNVAEGGLMFLEEYYANIYQGYFSIVEEGEEHLVSVIEESDETLAESMEYWEIVYEPFKIAMECFFEAAVPYRIVDAIGQIKVLFNNITVQVTGKGHTLKFKSSFAYEHFSPGQVVGILAECVAALGWLITHLPPIHEKLDESVWGQLFIVSISASFVGFGVYKAIKASSHHAAANHQANGSKSTEFGFWGMVIVTAILVAVQVAIFIAVLATGESIDGVDVGLMIVNTILTVVVIVIFAIISAIPVVGPLIVAIYNLINTILSEFLGINITEKLIQCFTDFIVEVDPMVELSPSTGDTLFGFLTERGVSVGNSVNISFPMRVKATQIVPDDGGEASYLWPYDEDLTYTRASIEVDGNESAIDEDSDWWGIGYDHTDHAYTFAGDRNEYDLKHGYSDVTGQLDTIEFTQAGINQAFTYESRFDYKYRIYLCVLMLFCDKDHSSGSIEEEPTALYFDVMPATLNEFYALNWGGSMGFPSLHDHDNDGLVSGIYNGNDPNDMFWDTDGDLLSDSWELNKAAAPPEQGGFAFDPSSADTDNDGLGDAEEARLGTDPAVYDTDIDGRTDLQEAAGYNFYWETAHPTLVFSNPLAADTDSDGLDDMAEYSLHKLDPAVYPYNPRVKNTSPLDLQITVGNRGFVMSGATVPLTVTALNNAGSPVRGTFSTKLPPELGGGSLPTQSFSLWPAATVSQVSAATVAGSIPAGRATITSTACGALWPPLVHLPFEEASGSKTFYNQATLGRYDAVCSIYGCPTAGETGRVGKAIHFTSNTQRPVLNNSASDLNFSGMAPFSLSVWIKPDKPTSTNYAYIIAKSDTTSLNKGFNLYLAPAKSTGDYFVGFNNEMKNLWYMGPANLIQPLQWYSLIATFDNSGHHLYVNGVEVPLTPQTYAPLGASTAPVGLGSLEQKTSPVGQYAQNYTGLMDELYIYDRALTAEEIASLSHPAALNASQPAATACQLSASQAATVTVDTDLPTASILSPAANTWLNGNVFQVVGGEARDPTSFISLVEVSLDNGPYQPASGAESWAYTLDLRGLAEGAHTLRARATDAVGHVSPAASLTVNVDRNPPALATLPATLPWPKRIYASGVNTWWYEFNGTVQDSRSGVKSVEMLLDGGPGKPHGGWQTAALNGTNWRLKYWFPLNTINMQPLPDPTGAYTLTLRATDKVGNVYTSVAASPALFDNTPPDAALTSLDPMAVITTPLTISGVMTDTVSGNWDMEVALIPVEQAQVGDNPALLLHFNEYADADGQSVMDASGFNQTGYSDSAHAPSLWEPPKVDRSWSALFAGDDYLQWDAPLKTPFTDAVTAAMWFKTSGTLTTPPANNPVLLVLGDDLKLSWKASGGLTWRVADGSNQAFEVSSNQVLYDKLWHLVVATWDGSTASIYIDGVLAGATPTPGMGLLDTSESLLTVGNSAAGGSAFNGYLDEVMLFARAFKDQDAANLYQRGNIRWYYADVPDNYALHSHWSYPLPTNLEGLYEIELRGMDLWDNISEDTHSWGAWQGEIDQIAPRVTLKTVDHGATTTVTCHSIDYNLTTNNYQCPCPLQAADKLTYDVVSSWYLQVTHDNKRLHQIKSTCDVPTSSLPVSMQACDKYGRCATAASSAPAPLFDDPAAPLTGLPSSALIAPADRSVLTSLDPLSLTVAAEALSGLKAISVTLDGGWLAGFSFSDASQTSVVTATTWTPAPGLSDGAHLLQSAALDWLGQAQTELFTTTVIVDTQPPTVDISPDVLTTTHMLSTWGARLAGPVFDAAGVAEVQVALQEGAGPSQPLGAAAVAGGEWSYPWRPYPLPDGAVVNVTATASDPGGRSVQASRPVTVDLVPPAPVTITLAYVNAGGVLTPVTAGQTIRDVLNPTLYLTWTASTDGSGLRLYRAGLSQEAQPDLDSLAAVDPAGPRQYSQAAGEAQAYLAVVVAEDAYGNRRWNRLGPIYVDTPLTPDLIALEAEPGGSYRGWMDSGAAQIGVSRIISEMALPGLSLSGMQRFYASWDAAALRLAWAGADWQSEGDLFIYLNTGSGPATDQAHNPYPATAGDTLTLPFAADTLVWVSGAESASLLRWDGAAWAAALPDGLPDENFRFSARPPASLTDLYLPFALLGIADPAATPLDLIAFGSQKDALRLWTVQPKLNPHDSPLLSRLPHLQFDQHHLVLKHFYHWPNLALQQAPNQERFLDVDLRSRLRADPLGVITDTRRGGLYLAGLLRPSRLVPLVGQGQVIEYTLDYANLGEAASDGHLLLDLTASGSLTLPGGAAATQPDGSPVMTRQIDLGPVPAGARGQVSFSAVVDQTQAQARYLSCVQAHPGDPAACSQTHDLLHAARLEAALSFSQAPQAVINHYAVTHAVAADPPLDVAILGLQAWPGQPGQAAAAPLAVEQARLAANQPSIADQALALPPVYARSGSNTLLGSAHDLAGVSAVTVQVLDPYGDTRDTTCPVAAASGEWRCTVSLPAALDGQRFFARARASNAFGYTSEWSPWRVLIVDNQPPAASLDLESQLALTASVLGAPQTLLSGLLEDNNQVSRLELCLERAISSARCQPVELSASGGPTATWSAPLQLPLGVDYAEQTLSLTGWDAAGNRSSPAWERSFWFDTAPPGVTVTTQVASIYLPEYRLAPQPLLAGQASDGSGWVEIVVRLSSPETGAQQRTVIPVTAGQWAYLPELDTPGLYTLELAARDRAGNLTSLGEWLLQVVEFRYLFPLILK